MCIRDSYYLYHSFNIGEYWASIKICIRNGYTIEDGSMSVSYTHLDVYKRQDLCDVAGLWGYLRIKIDS